MAKRDKPSAPIVRKTARGLSPAASIDAEQVWADPVGTEYDLVKRTKRSWPQLKLYWSMLNRIVKATGDWPSSVHLSDEIKLTLGYRRVLANLRTGEVHECPDSIALDNMSHDEFMAYFEAAQALLAEKIGFDPLAFLEEAA